MLVEYVFQTHGFFGARDLRLFAFGELRLLDATPITQSISACTFEA